MKRMSVLFLVAVLVCAFASRANAQGTVTWDPGYPQAGGSSGTIVGQGTATPDSGWLVNEGTVIYWPAGGGVQQTQTFPVGTNWSFTITGLTPGVTYNLVVEVPFYNQQTMTTATVSPDPATATAAP